MGAERTDAWLEICIRDALKDDPDTPVPPWAKAIAKIEVWRASFDPNQRQGKMLEVEC